MRRSRGHRPAGLRRRAVPGLGLRPLRPAVLVVLFLFLLLVFVFRATGRLGGLEQLLLGLGDVGGPVGREVVPEGLDVAGLVLLGQPLELVEHALRQRCRRLLARAVVAAGLVEPQPADPDLELRVLLHLREAGEGVQAGLDLARQGLELAAGEEGLGLPEQAVLGGERHRELGLEPVELAAELLIVIHRRCEARGALPRPRARAPRARPAPPPASAGSRPVPYRSAARRRCSGSSDDLNWASLRTRSFS